MLKINQGIAIVCMVNNTAIKLMNNQNNVNHFSTIKNETSSQTCAIQQTVHKNSADGSFVWTKNVQGTFEYL